MPRRLANNVLSASTIDILNVIRQNASYEYQSLVPEVTKESDIPKVGEVLYGTPALANQFINALVNRIALYRANSATFNNPYVRFKKGLIEYGETIEEIFAGLIKPIEFSAEKAAAREHKRYMPDVKSAFHIMNWRVLYPVTIQDDDLKQAFLSSAGVADLIAKIVDQIYVSESYDEFLLFKYLIIKAVSHGKMKPIAVDTTTDLKEAAVSFRGTSNKMTFISTDYNEAGVRNNTPKDRQAIFMSAEFNAQFDVDVLSAAFNMNKADFISALYLIDDWTTFDNERFDIIRANSDGLEEVTAAELALMGDVIAILVDENWFQVYDNLSKMTEQYTASGLYWNYFYHVWKTISNSPFSNAVVFVDTALASAPASIKFKVASMDVADDTTTVINLILEQGDPSVIHGNYRFIQNEECTENGIAVHPYGSVMFKAGTGAAAITTLDLEVELDTKTGPASYVCEATLANVNVGTELTFAPPSP